MSKEVQPCIFIDEDVSSVKSARYRIEGALFKQKELKADLLGLIMATPKDITPDGVNPIDNIKSRFEDIFGELWDAIVDEYKYTAVADDVEFNDESLVQKVWDEEKKSMEELREEESKRSDFFNKFRDVLNPYNIDDYLIYEEFKNGNIVITEPFTKEQRAWHIEAIRKRGKKILEEALKRIKEDGK